MKPKPLNEDDSLEYLSIGILALRHGVAESTLVFRINAANRKKPGSVRSRGERHNREYAVVDVRRIAGGQRGSYRRRVG